MADFITIQSKEMESEATLYHVKAMGAKNYNSSIEDIYEVVGQAIKSTIWLKTKLTFLQKIRSRKIIYISKKNRFYEEVCYISKQEMQLL